MALLKEKDGRKLPPALPRQQGMGMQPETPGLWMHQNVASNVAWSTAPTTTNYTSASAVLNKTT